MGNVGEGGHLEPQWAQAKAAPRYCDPDSVQFGTRLLLVTGGVMEWPAIWRHLCDKARIEQNRWFRLRSTHPFYRKRRTRMAGK